MAIKKITLTEDHIKLIKCINFERFNFDDKEKIEDLRKLALSLELKSNPDKATKSYNDTVINDIRNFDSPSRYGWGIDQWNMYGGTFILEDIALVLGKFDQAVPGTEESPLGRQFPKELEDYMWSLHGYICDNMEYIMSLIFQYAFDGGLTPGTYKCIDNLKIWEKIS